MSEPYIPLIVDTEGECHDICEPMANGTLEVIAKVEFHKYREQEALDAARMLSAVHDFANAALEFVEYEKAMEACDDIRAMILYDSASRQLRAALYKATGNKP